MSATPSEMSYSTLELLTAGAFALFMFFLALYVMRGDGGAEMHFEIPAPKNPIGFSLPS